MGFSLGNATIYETRKFNLIHWIILYGISVIVFGLLSFWEGTGMKERLILDFALSYCSLIPMVVLWWLFHSGSVHGNDLVAISNNVKPMKLFISKIIATLLVSISVLALWLAIRYVYGVLVNLPVPSYLTDASYLSLFVAHILGETIITLLVATIVLDYNFIVFFLAYLMGRLLLFGIIYTLVILSGVASTEEIRELVTKVLLYTPHAFAQERIQLGLKPDLLDWFIFALEIFVLLSVGFLIWSKWRQYGLRKLFIKA